MKRRIFGFSAAALGLLAGCSSVSGLSGSTYNGPTSLAAIRAENGLTALTQDRDLDQAAAEQAGMMAQAGVMSHSAGARFATRMRGHQTNGAAAENIAHGAFGTDELFRRWMESPPHRRNMLNPAYTRYGLASAADRSGGGRRYWALVLAR